MRNRNKRNTIINAKNSTVEIHCNSHNGQANNSDNPAKVITMILISSLTIIFMICMFACLLRENANALFKALVIYKELIAIFLKLF